MSKLSLVAGIAGVAMCIVVANTVPASADACLNPFAGVVSLSHDDMVPGKGYGYDKQFVNTQLANGNDCATTQQSSPIYQYNRRDQNANKGPRGTFQ